MRCDAWVATLLWWSCQSPVAHSCSLLNHLNSFHRGMFKLNTKFDVDLLLYSLSHFECDGHTAHMLNQWHLPPPLTSTVKLSLFTQVHSSALLLAARLQWCRTNCSRYSNNGWTFSGQTSYKYIYNSYIYIKFIYHEWFLCHNTYITNIYLPVLWCRTHLCNFFQEWKSVGHIFIAY